MPPASKPSADDARIQLESLDKNSQTFRLLDAFLTHAPTAEGVDVIASDIVTASAVQGGLDELAEFYTTGLILPSKFQSSH